MEINFLSAAALGDFSLVKRCIDEKVDIDFTDNVGMTALHYALSNNKCEIASFLIKHGANHSIRDSYHVKTAKEFVAGGKCRIELLKLLPNSHDILQQKLLPKSESGPFGNAAVGRAYSRFSDLGGCDSRIVDNG